MEAAPEPSVGQVLQHLMQASLHQHEVTQELANSVKSTTEELLELRRWAPATSNPLPDPGCDDQHRLNKLSTKDDVEAILDTFERTADRKGWLKRDWVDALTLLLIGDAQLVYYALDPESARNYETVNEEILVHCGRSHVTAAGNFHIWWYEPTSNPRRQLDDLLQIVRWWLQYEQFNAKEVMERVVMDQFLRALPTEERKAVRLKGRENTKHFLSTLEHAKGTLEMGPHHPQPRKQQVSERVWERKPLDSRPTLGPIDEPMPTELDLRAPYQAHKQWLKSCSLHTPTIPKGPRLTVEVNGQSALLDSGSTVMLARPAILPPP
ncbi:hypothetical protein Q7C36_022033 [Tachysurus vachellii]|uniref:SCAN box domain-containing protein n=1 Tax=Tachysurus vachellii TaxID=175792 RepID=A0AA88IP28_TACVA|nr:hypothetical protein Q7C36_022033 [Tachysurus vachellii]